MAVRLSTARNLSRSIQLSNPWNNCLDRVNIPTERIDELLVNGNSLIKVLNINKNNQSLPIPIHSVLLSGPIAKYTAVQQYGSIVFFYDISDNKDNKSYYELNKLFQDYIKEQCKNDSNNITYLEDGQENNTILKYKDIRYDIYLGILNKSFEEWLSIDRENPLRIISDEEFVKINPKLQELEEKSEEIIQHHRLPNSDNSQPQYIDPSLTSLSLLSINLVRSLPQVVVDCIILLNQWKLVYVQHSVPEHNKRKFLKAMTLEVLAANCNDELQKQNPDEDLTVKDVFVEVLELIKKLSKKEVSIIFWNDEYKIDASPDANEVTIANPILNTLENLEKGFEYWGDVGKYTENAINAINEDENKFLNSIISINEISLNTVLEHEEDEKKPEQPLEATTPAATNEATTTTTVPETRNTSTSTSKNVTTASENRNASVSTSKATTTTTTTTTTQPIEAEKNSAPKEEEKSCIVVIGSTGVGKSSLIRLFCGDNVKISNGYDSCTMDNKLYQDNETPNRWFLDTVGAEDSRRSKKDEEILMEIFRYLYDNKLFKVKIVWVCNKNERMSSTLQQQAEFICEFLENQRDRIWESVLLVCKKGETEQDIQGAIAASQKYGATKVPYHYGYTCMDWLESDMHKAIFRKMSVRDLMKIGMLSTDQVKIQIDLLLAQIPFMTILFNNEKCSKCGVVADHRFMPLKCHSDIDLFHPSIEPNVAETERFCHAAELLYYHPVDISEFHPGEVSLYHVGTTYKYHPGKWLPVETGINYSHIGRYEPHFVGGCCGFGEREEFRWTCCGNLEKGAQGCKSEAWMKGGCYECCNKKDDKDGCQDKYNCCDRDTKEEGCTYLHSCCKQRPEEPKPCSLKYSCCNQVVIKDSNVLPQGCLHKYTCCNRVNEQDGCVYKCCKKQMGQSGCVERCRKCKCAFDNTNYPGCTEESKHNIIRL